MKIKRINDHDYDVVWDVFDRDFGFQPSTTIFPGVKSSLPSLKLDLTGFRDAAIREGELAYKRLINLAQDLFAQMCKKDETIYALDWNHECFEFSPYINTEEWPLPVYPDGDYYIFLTKDFKNVWFGHPWERTITLFGDAIVPAASNRLDEFKAIRILPVT